MSLMMSTLTMQEPVIKQSISLKNTSNHIPLVHVLTSRTDNDHPQKNVPFDFEKMIKFLLDPHSAHLVDRRIRLCHKLLRHQQNGYMLKDLHYLMAIFNILANLCQEQSLYIEPFLAVLNHCSHRFLLDRSTDADIYSSVLVAFYSDFGYLLRIPHLRIQQCILQTLYRSIQSAKKSSSILENNDDGLRTATIDYHLRIQCHSDLCETLVQAISLFENDLTLRISIIKLLQIYSSKSPDCVAKMLTYDCINRLVSKMNDNDPTGESIRLVGKHEGFLELIDVFFKVFSQHTQDLLLFRTIEVLWNLLEYGDEAQICDQLNSRVTLSLLQEAFLGQVTQSHSQYHRQLRNDILIVVALMVSLKPDIPIVETGFAKQLLLFASCPELRSNSPLVKNFKYSAAHEDFEFKKLLINTVVILSRNPAISEIMINSRILLGLLSYIEPLPRRRNQSINTFEWTTSQYEELQLHALVALSILLPRSLNEYFDYQIGTRLLMFLEWTISKDDQYKSQGHSFFGKDGRDNKQSQLRYVLRLLRSLVSTRHERILLDLCDQGIIPTITGCLREISEENSMGKGTIDLDIISDGLFILSCFGETDIHRKEIFGTEGIDAVIKFLLSAPSSICGGLGYHRLLVSTIDCVWCCIVGSVINEDEFIQKQGVFALLDLIETNPKSLQNIILGCILDLTENPKCLHFLLAWQGSKQQQITHLLCELWRDEECEIQVARTDRGVISDHKKPLMGVLQQSVDITPLKSSEPSRAVLDLIDNMRSKIYGIFSKLGFADLPGLQDDDFVTLCIIENFLDFKMGEIWEEIMTELELEGVKIVGPDGEATDTILRASEERGLAVAATQNYVVEQYHKQDLQLEKYFYEDLIKSHLFQEKRLDQWKSFIARTSKYPLLMAAKHSQNQAIRQSRRDDMDYSGYHTVHNLEIPNLAITAFTGPFLQIESTPVDLLNQTRSIKSDLE